jgi:PAS domain S-box-containing protein
VLEYTGLSEEEIQGSGWTKSVHPDDIDAMVQGWASSIATGRPFRFEFRGLRAADHTYRWCVSSALPLENAGRIVKWYGTVVDLHDWKQAEDALRGAQLELARISRLTTVAELSASIAHELRQPLTAAVTQGTTCQHWLSKKNLDLDKARNAAERTVAAAQRASEVMDRIRALLNNAPPKPSNVAINDLLAETLAIMDAELRARDIVVDTQFAKPPVAVVGDRVQLQQVVMNLVMNGIEAMSAVSDRPRLLRIRSQSKKPAHVLVSVEDSGTGFDSKILNKIFDPFFTTKSDGMGMGLSICRTIIERHDGRLWALPASGQGALVQFTLPTRRPTEKKLALV